MGKYYSKSSLLINLYILPNICLFGIIANILNIICFANRKMKDSSFKYMLAISISDLFYLSLCLYGYIVLCPDCPLNELYFNKLYEICIDDYFTSCLAIFSISTDIVLSFQRTFLLLNKPFCVKVSHKIILGLVLLIALIYYTPVLFFKKIVASDNLTNVSLNQIKYKTSPSDIGSSLYAKYISISLAVIRMFLGVFVLSSINLTNLIIFKKRVNKTLIKKSNSNNLVVILLKTVSAW